MGSTNVRARAPFSFVRGAALAAAILAAGAGAACAQPPPPVQSIPPIDFATSGDAGFDAWRSGFALRALADGRSRETVTRLLSGLRPEQRIIDLDRCQPEFTSAVWDYIDRAVSTTRIVTGRSLRRDNAALLDAVEARFGVDADIIAGIWAMETNFGTYPLEYNAPAALATLAFEGRRRAQFETYLLALIEMVDRGYAGDAELRSSWAGALGQPQFMPDVYLSLAADWDGDGRRDIWGNRGDVLASIGNYLAQRGWRRGEPIFEEVSAPPGFDYATADAVMRDVQAWAAMGIRPMNGGAFSQDRMLQQAQLFLPAGAQGPKLLLYPNFQVIKRYNNSDRYALSVAMLARAFEGGPASLAAEWPRRLGHLNRDEIIELQTLLNAQGFNAGSIDGQFGTQTRTAVRSFQSARGLPADGYPTNALLQSLRSGGAPASVAAPASATAPEPESYGPPSGRALRVAEVRELQRLLQRLGYEPGRADGSVGPRTREAIAAFERSVGRRVTGAATAPVLTAARRAARR
ncbi:MAG: lytic murein transglycosylase [Alphaproteobacteria bacterium]|nr:lytic murein transglycosylase [Alphaproteobacteria bacterium]